MVFYRARRHGAEACFAVGYRSQDLACPRPLSDSTKKDLMAQPIPVSIEIYDGWKIC